PVASTEASKLLEASPRLDEIAADDENGPAGQIHYALFIIPWQRYATAPLLTPFLSPPARRPKPGVRPLLIPQPETAWPGTASRSISKIPSCAGPWCLR